MKYEWLWPPKHGFRSTKNCVSKWNPFSEVFIVTGQKESQSKVSVKVIAAAKCWGLCHKSQCSPMTPFPFEWGEVSDGLAQSVWWWERCWVSHRWAMCCSEEGSPGKFPMDPANTPALQKSRECQSTTLVGVVSFPLKTQVHKGIAQHIRHLERTHQSPQRREDKAGNKKLNYL